MALIGTGALWGIAAPLTSADALTQPITANGRRIYDDVLEYFRHGPQRTGSEGNVAVARWLKQELERAGGEAELQPWTITQFELLARRLSVGGEALEVFPIWLPRPTGVDGVRGVIAEMGDLPAEALQGKIGLFEADASTVSSRSNHPAMIARAADAGAAAVICSNGGEMSDDRGTSLVRVHRLTQNVFAPYNQRQWSIPAATVAFKDFAKLRAAVGNGAQAHLTIEGHLQPNTRAYNVIGRIERNTRPIVVATPLSGWLDSAGERGGGIALWLELARWAARPERKATYVFVATSGHEIGHVGQDHFIRDRAPAPNETHVWVHLGSGLGSYQWDVEETGFLRRYDSGGVMVAGASKPLEGLVKGAFGDLAPHYFPAEKAHGELRGSHDAGYTTFGLYGGNIFSHSAFDGPEQVSPALLDRLAGRLKRCLTEIEKSV